MQVEKPFLPNQLYIYPILSPRNLLIDWWRAPTNIYSPLESPSLNLETKIVLRKAPHATFNFIFPTLSVTTSYPLSEFREVERAIHAEEEGQKEKVIVGC